MFCQLLILLKMTIKKIVSQLETYILHEYPHCNTKFYSNRRNNYIHLGIDKSLFQSIFEYLEIFEYNR